MPASFPRLRPLLIAIVIVILGAMITAPGSTEARETRTIVDTWTLEIGFVEEPPIQSDTNGLWVKVTQEDQPVEGLEATLSAQAIFAGQARELPLTPVAGQPGVYTSVFIPTQPGEYSLLLKGTIGDQPIEETFNASPEGVPLVASRLDYEFPTAANGIVSNAAYPAAIGGALLLAGLIGLVARRNRH
ncbi:MAG TPA: hypothetical protein VGR29_10730 [Thermomicrobiales bacterium]|nr:hypothetical protein [Thermomicrobiales bacterium]